MAKKEKPSLTVRPPEVEKAREEFVSEPEKRKKSRAGASKKAEKPARKSGAKLPHPPPEPSGSPSAPPADPPPAALPPFRVPSEFMTGFFRMAMAFSPLVLTPWSLALSGFVAQMKAGDPQQEERAIREVASYGKQLHILLDAVEALAEHADLDRIPADGKTGEQLSEKQQAAIAAIRRLRHLKSKLDSL